jgi:hypothetical protein
MGQELTRKVLEGSVLRPVGSIEIKFAVDIERLNAALEQAKAHPQSLRVARHFLGQGRPQGDEIIIDERTAVIQPNT